MAYFVNEPVVPMREEPAAASKIVSQALFGEEIEIEKYSGEWTFIRTPDGYGGWSLFIALVDSSEDKVGECVKISRLAAHVYGVPDLEFGPKKTLPYGSTLRVLEGSDPRWARIAMPDGEECYIQKGDLVPEAPILDKKDLVPFSKRFLGLPYTWGGRSSFGFDCSGFVQMLYSHLGILLPRDSIDQVKDPRLVEISLEKLEPGDLVFFGKMEGRIGHVGLFLGNGEMIHATAKENRPYLRISKLSEFEWSGDPQSAYPYRTARKIYF